MRAKLAGLFKGAMRGRTMYVVPFCMGPLGSKISALGVEITDSAYVAISMRIMTRMGKGALDMLGEDGFFVPAMHTLGAPLEAGQQDVAWPCNDEKWIVHFPESREIWSYGSGYGGNALLGKKCYALRIASVMARDEGWLAEHMLILKLTSPEGASHYIAAAFPSACGKTNLAMLQPTIPGWKAETIGDDICWMRFGEDGRLYAINPEAGFFGVAPGTGEATNKSAIDTLLRQLRLHQRRADRRRRRLVGRPDRHPAGQPDRLEGPRLDRGLARARRAPQRALHRARQPMPGRGARMGGPRRRADLRHPVRRPARLGGAAGQRGVRLAPRRLPGVERRLGRHGGGGEQGRRAAPRPVRDAALLRLQHGRLLRPLAAGIGAKADPAKLPRIYFVNWFRKDERGKFVWPGFGENSRVLKWIAERLEGKAEAVDTPIGRLPAKGALDVEGLDLTDAQLDLLLTVDPVVWKEEAQLIPAHYEKFGERLPQELWDEFDALNERLEAHAEAVTERSGGKISLLPVGNASSAPYTRSELGA